MDMGSNSVGPGQHGHDEHQEEEELSRLAIGVMSQWDRTGDFHLTLQEPPNLKGNPARIAQDSPTALTPKCKKNSWIR